MERHDQDLEKKVEELLNTPVEGEEPRRSEAHHHRHHHHHSSHSESDSKKKSKKTSVFQKLKGMDNRIIMAVCALLIVGVLVLVARNAQQAANLQSATEQLEEFAGSSKISYSVPDYWEKSTENAIKKVQALLDEGGRDAVAFAWFSDVQYSTGVGRNQYTGALAAAVMDACNIPYAIHSGDLLTEAVLSSSEEVKSAYANAYAMLAPIGEERLLQVAGSHDGTYGSADLDLNGKIESYEEYCYNLPEEQLYNLMFRQHAGDSRRVYGSEGDWYYLDDTTSKTRFIMLNSAWTAYEETLDGCAKNNKTQTRGFGQAQLQWLVDTALRFEEAGWGVVVVAHSPLDDADLRDGAIAEGILNAFKNKTAYQGSYGTAGSWDHVEISANFTGTPAAQLMGWFSGSLHRDRLAENAACPVLSITSSGPDSTDETEEERMIGTDTETAMDFVVINRKNGKVSLVRLGVGVDRSYAY
ncbi:MAG: hypothetical protein IJ043_09450 [Clostridia bacterium]|nr:hypothetical protein [Clostridia bacterium]